MCCGDRYNIHVVQRVIGTDFPLKLLQHLINLDKAEQRGASHPTNTKPLPPLRSPPPFLPPLPCRTQEMGREVCSRRGPVNITVFHLGNSNSKRLWKNNTN